LKGAGGNIGVSAGEDGVFIIDDEFAPLAPKVKAALSRISKKPLRFVFNTHWHGDHTGGNEAFAGAGALIVAHDNVRSRMSVQHFRWANVVHAGDCFVHGRYPTIDYSTGGTIDGYIAAQAELLQRVDARTKIIPGHGPLGDKAALQSTHDMLVRIRNAVAASMREKKTLQEVIATKPTAPWDATYGNGFIKPDVFVTTIYKTLQPAARPTSKPRGQ
jgi:cyclase